MTLNKESSDDLQYIFEPPLSVKIVHSKLTCCHGGGADGVNKIYLYGFESDESDNIDKILTWSSMIQHEYLHIILNKFKINPNFHHSIIDKLEWI